jgi:hypothetical protein
LAIDPQLDPASSGDGRERVLVEDRGDRHARRIRESFARLR